MAKNDELIGDPCPTCEGTGRVIVDKPKLEIPGIGFSAVLPIAAEATCGVCKGTGVVNSPNACTVCKGSGSIAVPNAFLGLAVEDTCGHCEGTGIEPTKE